MTEPLIIFAVGLACGMILAGVAALFMLFTHQYNKIINDNEEIYGSEEKTTDAEQGD